MLHFLFHCLLMIFVLFKLWCLSFGHDLYWSCLYYNCWRRQWQANPVLLPGNPLGKRSLVGCRLWCRTESDMTEATSRSSSKLRLWQLCQFSSATQLCLPICDPMDGSTPGFPVHHQLLELAQTHVHRVGDAIQPSHPPFPFFSCLQSVPVSGSFQMSQCFPLSGKLLELQHQSFQWIFRTDFI